MLQTKTKNTIKKYKLFSPSNKTVVGVSGGPDSVCLLYMLHNLGYQLIIVHLNYGLRGKDSDKDEKFVKDLAKKLNLLFISKKINISKNKGNLEEKARDARYEFFKKVAYKHRIDKIAIAHTADDQIETVLMNMLRGTGLRGLCGMKYITKQSRKYKVESRYEVIRPFLDIWRLEIEEYLNKNKILYRTDNSNFDLRFTRNHIRHRLIPALEAENLQFKKMFLKKIKKFQNKYKEIFKKASSQLSVVSYSLSDKAYFPDVHRGTARPDHKMIGNREIVLDSNKFNKSEPSLQSEILRLAIEKITGNLKNITEINTKQSLKLIKSGKTGSQIHLQKKLRIFKDYDKIKISLQSTNYNPQLIKKKVLQIPGITEISEINMKIKTELQKKAKDHKQWTVDKKNAFLDLDKCKKNIYIQGWKKGDWFYPLGMQGKKKLQDFFTDNKISKRTRKQIPIIVTEKNRIIWIAGFQLDNRFKITDKTKKILKLEII